MVDKNRIILVDCDDTIFNTLEAWINKLNIRYNTNVSLKDITDWHLINFFKGLTQNEISSPLFEDGFWDEVTPKEDAVEYLTQLYTEGFEIYITTATHCDSISSKFEHMIHKYLPFIDYRHIIIAYDKGMINGLCLVDDHPANFDGGTFGKILFDAPHNKNYIADDVIRVYNWKECYEKIEEMYNATRY